MTAPAAPAVIDRPPPDRPPSAMTSREIAAYNQGLPRDHPNFIRCRSFDEIGSWAKKSRVCRTNGDWKLSERNGNDNARETLEAMRRAPVNGSN
jgi:hypothetical protein